MRSAHKTTHTVIPSEAEGSHEISPLLVAVGNASVEMTGENNRLAAAKMFADELNDSRLWKIKISYQKRWTKHRRAQKAIEIQMTKPWLRATGPKSAAGKLRASGNWMGAVDALDAEVRLTLRDYGRYLTAMMRAQRLGDPQLLEYYRIRGRALTIRLRWLAVAFVLDREGYFPCYRAQQSVI